MLGRNLVEEEVNDKITFSRHNEKKEREKGAITPQMLELARHTNDVDIELYEFVTAKFCARLRDSGLLGEPVVQEELSHREELEERYRLCEASISLPISSRGRNREIWYQMSSTAYVKLTFNTMA